MWASMVPSFRTQVWLWAINTSALRYSKWLPEADEVEISKISEEKNFRGTNIFQIAGEKAVYKLEGKRTISGLKAQEFARSWKRIKPSLLLSGLCHKPGFGIR